MAHEPNRPCHRLPRHPWRRLMAKLWPRWVSAIAFVMPPLVVGTRIR
jgi:hypothetical protein